MGSKGKNSSKSNKSAKSNKSGKLSISNNNNTIDDVINNSNTSNTSNKINNNNNNNNNKHSIEKGTSTGIHTDDNKTSDGIKNRKNNNNNNNKNKNFKDEKIITDKKKVNEQNDNKTNSNLLENDGKKKKNHHHHHHKNHKRRSFFFSSGTYFGPKRFIFIIGTLLGVLGATYWAHTNNIVDVSQFGYNLNDLSDFGASGAIGAFSDFVDELSSKLPLNVLKEAKSISETEAKLAKLSKPFAAGRYISEQNLTAKYPVVAIPGVISTGLESWEVTTKQSPNSSCSIDSHFRKRLWGSWHMISTMLFDKKCWLENIMLNPETGLDPPNVKLRAAQGFEAADFFVTGYWIWNKLVENLAALSYDPNNFCVASYDWRLTYLDLERRDGYFSKLKMQIETNKALTGEKTVIVGHSMGSQVIFYFMKWVEASGPLYGNGGPKWVNNHIAAVIDIAGSMLGTPKSIVAVLSGEMKDTIQLNALAIYGLEQFFSRYERTRMLHTFGGVASMFPKGGNRIWGNIDGAPDDPPNANISFGQFIGFKKSKSKLSERNLTVEDALDFLYTQTPDWYTKRVKENFSTGYASTAKQLKANEKDQSKWINPLEVALPYAPDMKIYSFYGVGKPTERSYWYTEVDNKDEVKLNVTMDKSVGNTVLVGEGDGTVSLITHAISHIWKMPKNRFNPAGIEVKIVEMLDEPERFDIRGGPQTADHVDILGRAELNELILRVVAGAGDDINERIQSNITEYISRMDLDL